MIHSTSLAPASAASTRDFEIVAVSVVGELDVELAGGLGHSDAYVHEPTLPARPPRHYRDDVTSIAIPLFPHFTALDGIGPYEVLQRIPHFDVTFIGHERGVVRSDNGMLGIEVDATFEELPTPDVVVFPGGFGTRALMTDERVLDWVRTAHASTTYTTSVCTGSLVLAAAGLLAGPDRDHALGCPRRPERARRTSRPASASSSTSTSGSSRRRACRAGSTWHFASSSCSSIGPLPRPLSS